jgi:4-amino-4-deoxy-L-arabinose transferase-like glycosyltransferase
MIILGACLPGFFSIPVVDRDEARFAQASRQMFESMAWPEDRLDTRGIVKDDEGRLSGGFHAGGWAVPMVGDRPRLAKPPLIYWLQVASAAVLSGADPLADRIWHYRVPSLLSTLAACILTWRIGVGLGRSRAGWLGGVLLGVSPMVVWDAHQARADQLLLAVTTGAMAALFWIWRTKDEPTGRRGLLVAALFWVMIGAGVLTKGPVTPMVAVLAAVGASVVSRRWRWLGCLRPLPGLVVLAVMIGPWLVATADAVGWYTLWSIWLDETLGRSAAPKEGHWGPPGYHLVLLAVLFWPGSLMTLDALKRAARVAVYPGRGGLIERWKSRSVDDHAALFLLSWIVPAWLVFELIGTKLPHYTLPLYPPLALLTGWAVVDTADRVAGRVAGRANTRPGAENSVRTIPLPGLVLWSVLGVALTAAAPAVAITMDAPAWVRVVTVVTAVFGVGVIVAAFRAARHDQLWTTHALALGAALLLSVNLLQTAMPNAASLRVTASLADLITLAPPGSPVATSDYREDSLTFVTRGRLETIRPDDTDAWALLHPGGVLIMDAGSPGPSGWRELGRVEGFNYSKGDRIGLRVWVFQP